MMSYSLAILLCLASSVWFTLSHAAERQGLASMSQAEQYAARVPKTIIELQQFRQTSSIRLDRVGGTPGTATLINLQPAINTWYVLRLAQSRGASEAVYHLENTRPQEQRVLLEADYPHGLVLVAGAETTPCELWSGGAQNRLDEARRSRLPYAPLCEGRLLLRNPTQGHRTPKEMVADFLRDRIWGGDKLVGFVRDTFFEDTHRQQAEVRQGKMAAAEAGGQSAELPRAALIASQYADRVVTPPDLGLALASPPSEGMVLGAWYAAQDNPGVYVSVLQPSVIAPDILRSHPQTVNPLDNREATALVYLVAFDLDRFDLGFALGTDHPRVGWSERVLPQVKNAALPGPDGIGDVAPLVRTGLISPVYAPRTVATFTGGFKRSHGAFRSGQLGLRNHGSHYGFIEHGVVFSTLQPGLATLVVLDDGSVRLQTWSESDNALLPRIRHARQNGVPLVEFDAAAQAPVPGALVNRWGPGNWSGSADKSLRTLRAGVCLQEHQGRRFLIYGYFSSATPSAMARVFQAYVCHYAMLMDMNALEHTYLALYRRQGTTMLVQHMVQGMSVLDKSASGAYVPRFLGYPDNRDFFYLMRREAPKETP
jgi:hypothetical protein